MSNHHASCSCGQLKVTCDGDPIRVSMCHCLAGQTRTGSVFGAQARWAEEKTKIEGRSKEYLHIGDSGGHIHFFFCPDCGSTVHWHIDEMPGVVAVPVGALADPTFSTPTFSVYEARKHS